MTRVFRALALCFTCAVTVTAAEATPVAPVNVPEMLRISDVVVLGTMAKRRAGRTKAFSIVLDVDQIIKGSLSGSQRQAGINFGTFPDGETFITKRGVFFLRADGNSFIYTRREFPFLPSPPNAYQIPSATSAPLDRICAALVSTFTVPARDAPQISRQLVGTSIVVYVPRSDNPSELSTEMAPPSTARLTEAAYEVDAEGLRSIPYVTRQPYLRRVAEGHGPIEGRVWAVDSMIEASDYAEAGAVKSYLLQPPNDLRVTSLNAQLALQSSRPTADDAPFLNDLLLSTSVKVRTGALYGLSTLGPTLVITNLETILRDPDQELKEWAVTFACLRIQTCGEGNWDMLARPEHISGVITAWREWLRTHK